MLHAVEDLPARLEIEPAYLDLLHGAPRIPRPVQGTIKEFRRIPGVEGASKYSYHAGRHERVVPPGNAYIFGTDTGRYGKYPRYQANFDKSSSFWIPKHK